MGREGRCTAQGPAGDRELTIDVGGEPRRYVVHVPSGLEGPAPLVVTAHGLGSSAREQLAASGFGHLADREGFIVVAPQARGTPAVWNFLQPLRVPTSDAAFLVAMVDDIAGRWCVDPARRYLTGISNGSALTFAAACAGDLGFAAYGGVAGALWSDRCATAPATSIIYFHGTGDQVVPFDGGRALFAPVAPAMETLQAWADHDGCAPARRIRVSAHVVRHRWAGCGDGAALEFYAIEGGGHTWPGSPIRTGLLGPTTTEISAAELMWEFFRQHPDR